MAQIDPKTLPKGIRNCNPGNLRAACGPSEPNVVRDGFAVFTDMTTGLHSMYWCIWNYYNLHKRTTLRTFIGAYAPASENDLVAYEKNVANWIQMKPDRTTTYDLQLNRAWNAVNLARAITRQENGVPPPGWRGHPEWCAVSEHATAILRTGKWIDA